MKFTDFTLRDLEYLVAVADHSHFGRAAAACHVSQPALSAQVRKAEDLLGIPVFERTKRSVRLTPAGADIVRQARVVLDEARKLPELATGRRAPLNGPFRLGAIATVGPYLLSHLIRPLRKRYPDLELMVREGLTDQLLRELKDGSLDAVIASPTFSDPSLRRIALYWEPFLVAAPAGHSVLRKKPLRSSDLDASSMVLLEDGHCLKSQALEFCPSGTVGGSWKNGGGPRFQASGLETLRHMVASGMGYTLLPVLAVRKDRELKGLVEYREFEKQRVGREIILVVRNGYPRMPDAELLSGLIIELAGRLPGGIAPFHKVQDGSHPRGK